MTHSSRDNKPVADSLTRPIIGIENRTAQEVFDIMCDRLRLAGQDRGEGNKERARQICAQARPDYAEGFLSGEYDDSSTEMRAVLLALSTQPPPVSAVRDILREIWLEASETIPPDGKEAAFAALGRIMTLTRQALAHSAVGEGYAVVPRDDLRDLRVYLEPARLREKADGLEGTIDRMPIRQLAKRVDEILARPIQAGEG